MFSVILGRGGGREESDIWVISITSRGFFPVKTMLETHHISSSLDLGLIRMSKANSSTILVTSWMKFMTAKMQKAIMSNRVWKFQFRKLKTTLNIFGFTYQINVVTQFLTKVNRIFSSLYVWEWGVNLENRKQMLGLVFSACKYH